MTSLPPLNPYPGLRPFRESEAHLFFGRSAHVDEVLAELDRSRFVAVMGASASGKSSLVYAGVLPALHGGFSPRAGSRWRVASLRPGANPIHHLARALAVPGVLGVEEPDPVFAAAQVEATLRRSGLGLVDAARQSTELSDGRLLVVVDQFEELFRFENTDGRTGLGDDADPFVQLLITAAEDDRAPVDVIITMRSDFLGDCSRLRDLPEAVNHGLYLVPRLTRSQLAEAITGPAAVGGATMSHRLVQRLLNDAGGDPDMLPVLQHALMRTWDIWGADTSWAPDGPERGPIDIDHYEACGGVRDALSRHADEAYFELADDRARGISELMFKRITELGDDHREVRRPTSLVEIAAVAGATTAEVTQCIDRFEEPGRSFVTLSADGIVDISHESLIRQWPRLNVWASQEAESRDVYIRLANAANRWEHGEAALLRDPDLQIASRWWTETQPNEAWAERYHPGFDTAARYLDDSRTAARRRRVAAVAGVTGLAVLALVTALLAGWANHQRDLQRRATVEAERQRRTAVARQLATSSADAGAPARSRSVLAAVEAVQATHQDGVRLPVAEEALRRALQGPLGVRVPSGASPNDQVPPFETAFSPDGALLATGDGEGVVRLWGVATPDADPRELDDQASATTALAFSADGRRLAAGGTDGTAGVWDLSDPATPYRDLPGHDDLITSLAFSPDGRRLVTASTDGTALLWDLEDVGAAAQPLPGHNGFVDSVAFSPDGTMVVTGAGDGIARLWTIDNLAAGARPLAGHSGRIDAVAISPDKTVATGGADGTARVWSGDGRERAVLRHRGPVDALAFSADGRWLATGSDDHSARLWDLHDPDGPAANPLLVRHDDAVDAVAFSSSGGTGGASRWLATGSRDATARLVDLERLDDEPVVLAGNDGPVTSIAFGDGGRWLATGDASGTGRVWPLDDLSTRPAELDHGATPDGPAVAVAALAFSPDGRQLATGASDKSVRLWDVNDPSATPALLPHDVVPGMEEAGITALAFSPDGRRLATGSGDEWVRLWTVDDVAAGPTASSAFPAGVTAVAFSPDGRQLAVGVKGEVAYLVDPADLARRRPLEGHADEVTSVAFSPDGARLATGSRDGTVLLREVGDLGAEPTELPVGSPVTSVAFRGDGAQLAVGAGTGVRVYDLDGGRPTEIDQLDARRAVSGVAFSTDGTTLVVASGRTVQLWDLSAPRPADPVANPVILSDHTDDVLAVAYSPDGAHFASGSEDGTARLWMPLDALVDLGCRGAGRNLTQDEWSLLRPDDPYHQTCPQWPKGP